jgi:hypothetical protein|uniref:Uncharacterized protein n=1 Tax=uncultured Rhodospirillales bacterium HF4000_24M03 TaxID=710788 RepID=E0XW39_9PROT|nr:hypothetical protein [uncultured Rhodospirillales bacterium HF4000_24M03]
MTKFPKPDKSESLPEQPWTIEADLLSAIRQISLNEAIDLVIVNYLKAGDTSPLAYWFFEGHCPSPTILKYIACMLLPGSGSESHVPFKLISKSRSPTRGRPSKGPQQKLRDRLIFINVASLIQQHGPGTYDSAITKISELQGLNEHIVKRAYDRHKASLLDEQDT